MLAVDPLEHTLIPKASVVTAETVNPGLRLSPRIAQPYVLMLSSISILLAPCKLNKRRSIVPLTRSGTDPGVPKRTCTGLTRQPQT